MVFPSQKSEFSDLKLSVSDLPMLSCHYIQKGLFFHPPPIPINHLFSRLASSLSLALSFFPPLAGRLFTNPNGHVFISSSTHSGSEFSLASAPSLTLSLLLPTCSDVPTQMKHLFPLNSSVSFDGHFLPLSSFQLTQFSDGTIFLACTINHAVVDGTSFWNFFNAWAELCRSPSLTTISHPPNFTRNFFPNSSAILRFPNGNPPVVTFPLDSPLRERIFHFRFESIQILKSKANNKLEAHGKSVHDKKYLDQVEVQVEDISSFQSLCAQLWRSVTRARTYLQPSALTTFRMAVNCRRRVEPKLEEYYFGNAIQSIPTIAKAGEIVARELNWIAGLLRRNVAAHGDETIRKEVMEWELEPKCFPLGNSDRSGLTMGSSPRFPMFEENDFGWGKPIAVRSGMANKFDGKISAFPGRDGGGSVDIEICLAPETMESLLQDKEFMYYVSEEEELVDIVSTV